MKISVFLIFSSLLFIYGCEDQKEVDQKNMIIGLIKLSRRKI